ncbi:hypothetical protein D3C83_239560 [compost metagenome]
MVRLAAGPLTVAPPVGFERARSAVSFGSSSASLTRVTRKLREVCPAANVRVPEAEA